MQTYVCTNCGGEQRRPTLPLRCPACGQQRVGLFKLAPAAPAPVAKPPAPPADAEPGAKQSTPAPSTRPSPPPSAAPVRPAPDQRAPDRLAQPPALPTASRQRPPAARAASQPDHSSAQPPARPAPRPQPAKARTPLPPSRRAAGEPGSIAWRYPDRLPGHEESFFPVRNCPAVAANGELYAALGRHLVALSEVAGGVKLLWKYATGGHIPGSPVLAPEGRIRVHAGDGRLHCVTADGQSAWPAVPVGEPLGWASPLVDPAGVTWLCAYGGGLLRVGPGAEGGAAVVFRSRQRFDSTGLLRDGVLYVGGEDGFVRAIEVGGGVGRNRWRGPDEPGKTGWFVNAALAVSPTGALIVAGRDEFLYAFDASGRIAGKLHIRGQMLGSPVVDSSGDIYVGVSLLERGREARGKLVCVSHDLRQVRWEYPAQGPVESTPVIGADGVIYCGDNAGLVHAVRADGRSAWQEPVGAAVRSAGSISAAGRVVFGLDDGTLVALASDSRGLLAGGWPKYLSSLENRGQ